MTTTAAPKFKLSHRNIRARYMLQKRWDPAFSYPKMAELFGVDKMCCYKWCRVILDENNKEIKDRSRCPMPAGKRAEQVLAWLNDGVLAQAYQMQKRKTP